MCVCVCVCVCVRACLRVIDLSIERSTKLIKVSYYVYMYRVTNTHKFLQRGAAALRKHERDIGF